MVGAATQALTKITVHVWTNYEHQYILWRPPFYTVLFLGDVESKGALAAKYCPWRRILIAVSVKRRD